MKRTHFYKTYKSPVGELKLVASDAGLSAVLWEDDDPNRVRFDTLVENNTHPILLRAEKEMSEYFNGERTVFTLPLDPIGTKFQNRVWEALSRIPFGQTKTYGQLAGELGNANASRAVGAANGKNPIAIVVPCHRVIGASGALTGFAGGLEVKEHLLTLEGVKNFHAPKKK